MQILCAYSGIHFSCDHFPGYLSSRETYHPVFNLTQHKLLSYLGKWSSGELTTTDSYLLFLALLRSSDHVEFRSPAIITERTESIVYNNMQHLAQIVSKLTSVASPSISFPRYVVSPDTKSLDNVRYWIENWQDSFADFQDGYKRDLISRELERREQALQRLIKNPNKPTTQYASKIAEWAAKAGQFPEFQVTSPFTGLPTSCSSYWRALIVRCATNDIGIILADDSVKNDMAELLDHCEDHIQAGTIYSNALFSIIRTTLKKQISFLDLGDSDLNVGTFQILKPEDSVESANISAMIQAAPDHEPKITEYPTRLAFFKAMNRWKMAQKYRNSQNPNSSGE